MGYIDEKGLEHVLRTVKEYVDTKTVDWDDITNTPCREMHNAVYIVSAYGIDNGGLMIGYGSIPLYIWNTNTGEVVQTGGNQIVEFNCTNGEVLKLHCSYQHYYPDSDSMGWHILPIQPVYESTDEICFGWYNVKTLDEKYIPDTIARKQELTELSAEVSGLSEGIALRNVGAVDTDESVDEPEIGGGGGASTDKQGVIRQTQKWTQAADMGYDYVMSNLVRGAIPQANIDLFTSAGAIFNEESGYFELNGLTDISYEEMCSIYSAYNLNPWTNQQGMLIVTGVRTFLHPKNNIIITTGFNGLRLCYSLIDIEIINMVSKGSPQFTSLQLAWFNNYKLTSIQNIIDVAQTTNFSQSFERCYSLVDVRLLKIKASVSFQYSARLSNSSILYMIQNEAATSAIVITLHADAYARAMADAEIQTALEAHPNVSLASA